MKVLLLLILFGFQAFGADSVPTVKDFLERVPQKHLDNLISKQS